MKQPTHAAEDLVQIGVLAERVGLSLRTVRYYEEIGLLEPAARTTGGFRLYAPEQEDRLRLLKTMKPLGFTLDEMRSLLTMIDDAARARSGSRRAAVLLQRIDELRQEISLRRGALLDQVKATEQITGALDAAARGLT
ncbi:MAG: MerR family transcriptional regulator [Candidatus Nanopelagicales bacterium]|jgi:MerR family transcriptional regulator, copper efflux regulator|nr:MerR family transcriptional regulator [Candidatus Nanopelagicales bacterium]MDP4715867.1 MerR family transcriptional regulator [Candidatus Nanopelagicales bacterium]MDP4907334.1 MerR family transcriptional regulator [Candidatus Nanopelagicales bacterium]MDP5094486.1 MerR family transcriptional regulator [Candidatus Nanopelagicales bacterium]